jgi:hypothetical protein
MIIIKIIISMMMKFDVLSELITALEELADKNQRHGP